MPYLMQLSLTEFSEHADQWDALWERSASRLPTNLAAGIQLWQQSFAADCELLVLAVFDGHEIIAGLPLLRSRKGPLTLFRLPSNCTVVSGDLLVDPRYEDEAIEILADGFADLKTGLLAFEGIEIEASRWQTLISKLSARHRVMHRSRGHDVGVVDVLHDWDAYQRSWSRNHRSSLKRTRNKLNAEGEVEVRRVRTPDNTALESLLDQCFAIEDRSWKGSQGTSILRSAGLREYFQQEAKLMRDAGMLDLWLLVLNGEPIAFEYCHFAKGVCLSHKISFDPRWDKFSPGRLLRYFQLEQYHQDPHCNALDTLGVLCEAKAKWITRRYRSSRLYVAIGGVPATSLRGWKVLRSLRNRWRPPTTTDPIKCGAESYLEMAKPPSVSAESTQPPVSSIPSVADAISFGVVSPIETPPSFPTPTDC